MVFETLVFSLLNHLTQLIAQENFIIQEFCYFAYIISLYIHLFKIDIYYCKDNCITDATQHKLRDYFSFYFI